MRDRWSTRAITSTSTTGSAGNGAIVARQQGITSADEAIAAAVRDHQATVPHQAARRGRGIPDGAPAPAIPGTLARHDPWPALCIAPGLHRCSAAEFR
jgi:hypothetical protein